MSEFKCPKCGAKLAVSASQTKQAMTVDDAKTLFPSELEAMLTFEEEGNFIIIKPRHFLGSDSFAKVASIVRDAGGEYISAGKMSHFKIGR